MSPVRDASFGERWQRTSKSLSMSGELIFDPSLYFLPRFYAVRGGQSQSAGLLAHIPQSSQCQRVANSTSVPVLHDVTSLLLRNAAGKAVSCACSQSRARTTSSWESSWPPATIR